LIGHLLKLVWRRKGANSLVIVEIFFSFLVVFAVVTAVIASVARWSDPLGFEWKNVLAVRLDGETHSVASVPDADPDAEFRGTMRRVVAEVKNMPQVASVAAGATPPYSNSTSSGSWDIDGKRIELTRDEVTDGFAETMRLKVLRGRWFGPQDDAATEQPVVLDTDLATLMYGDADPIGQKFGSGDEKVQRVVGLVPPYRKDGELSSPRLNMVFIRASLERPGTRTPRYLLVRVRPGTAAEFEELLEKRIHAIAPTTTFRVQRMDAMRAMSMRMRIAPVVILGVVGLFLVAMVALGLTGVMWQNVTRRTRELGLRRALGATGAGVRVQVLSEVALITTLATVVGVAIVLQLPILGVLRLVSVQVFAAGIASALALIYGITLLCAAYPSWMASAVAPAEALRHD
jgi:putative ABC transport system permease protein